MADYMFLAFVFYKRAGSRRDLIGVDDLVACTVYKQLTISSCQLCSLFLSNIVLFYQISDALVITVV